MIKELFLPEQIGNYYLFAKRIVGVEVRKTHISACQIYLKGNTIEIEKYIEEIVEPGTTNNWHERAVAALKVILPQLDKYDALHSCLSSSVVIFKELKLPFLTHDKIKMVINYEIEPLLPFPLSEAVVDFIITKQEAEQASSQVLAVAVQKQHIEQHVQLFTDAGTTTQLITVDIIALYGLYKSISAYAQLEQGVALIDLNLLSTRIAYIQDGQLRFVRTINKGTYTIAKIIGDQLNLQPNQVTEHMLRYGLEPNDNQPIALALTDALTKFLHEVQFTLNSFSTQAGQQNITKILILGSGAQIKGLPELATSILQVNCELIQITNIVHNSHIKIKNNIILPSSTIISVACALPAPITQEFNLLQNDFAPPAAPYLYKQLIVAIGLFLLIFLMLATNSYLQIRKLRNAAQSAQTEALEALTERKHFKGALEEGLRDIKEQDQLEEALVIAQNELKKQEDMWFAFAGNARASFLKYLLELTNKIDKDALGFELESLTISDHIMTIKARVKNHEALKLLEKELRSSKLFSSISSPEETSFTMTIGLAKNEEES